MDTTAGGRGQQENRQSYWDRFYAERATAARPLPSQFATFVAGELEHPHRIIEFGCGAGRDSVFFSSHGHDVTGIDASTEAVSRCRELTARLGLTAEFVVASVTDPSLPSQVRSTGGPTVIYARFFLHAVTEEEQAAWFEAARALTVRDDLLAVEYRTVRDRSHEKVTRTHYRRFIDPVAFNGEAAERGFRAVYAVEGFGFAKYRQDDAYVARGLFRRV